MESQAETRCSRFSGTNAHDNIMSLVGRKRDVPVLVHISELN